MVKGNKTVNEPDIRNYIYEKLSLDEQKVALDFISYLEETNMSFSKDNCDYWKDKIYYWVKLSDKCVCFIAIQDPDEKENHWTVWSDDMSSEWFEDFLIKDEIK